jgi:triosephosphate isomerase
MKAASVRSGPQGGMKLVVGNWKMHGSAAALCEFGDQVRHLALRCDAALCVPFPLLGTARAALQGTPLRCGAQDCSSETEGAFTGEVSAHLIREFGARYVIVGHSERRRRHGETDVDAAAKAVRVLAAGMTPIVCIGESADERDANQTEAVLRRQLVPLARALGRELASVVLAYEPVWAIGRGDAATPGLIEETHGFVRQALALAGVPSQALRILYGGSVSAGNAAAILAPAGVSGVLVGAASHRATDFLAICRAAGREPADTPALATGA